MSSLKNNVVVFVVILLAIPSFAAIQFSKYASDFLAIGVGARGLSMGGAYSAVADDITALYWNPAGLHQLKSPQIHFMHSERFAGIVNWDCLMYGMPVRSDLVIGIGFYRLGVDNIPLTRLTNPGQDIGTIYVDDSGTQILNTPYAYDSVNDTEMALVVGFGKRRTGRLAFGGNVKILRKDVGVADAWGIGFDAGVFLYPYKKLQVSTVLTDGTTTLIAWSTGRQELVAPKVRLGAAYPFQMRKFNFLPVVDLLVHNESSGLDSQIRLNQAGVNVQTGLEINYFNRVAFRFGSDAGRFVGGLGVGFASFRLDYGFASHADLGNSHRISFLYSILQK